jgi:AbiV family abortive infection protein
LTRKPTLKIPLNKVEEGADLCLQNALQFCSDADILMKQQSVEHALGLCILATEELGKAIMLKEKAAYARKRSEDVIVFERVKPEIFFKANFEDLKKIGFTGSKIHPFYDHLSKLLYTKNIRSLATHERIMFSLEGKRFQTTDEIWSVVKELKKQTQKVSTDLREDVFYVNYVPKKEKWKKGVKIDAARVKDFISDIEKAISLIGQWKVFSS